MMFFEKHLKTLKNLFNHPTNMSHVLLKNSGQTCGENASMQIMRASPEAVGEFRRIKDGYGPLYQEVRKIVLAPGPVTRIKPVEFISELSVAFNPGEQHDAARVFSYILSHCPSSMQDIFQFYSRDILTCSSCNKSRATPAVSYCAFAVPISRQTKTKNGKVKEKCQSQKAYVDDVMNDELKECEKE